MCGQRTVVPRDDGKTSLKRYGQKDKLTACDLESQGTIEHPLFNRLAHIAHGNYATISVRLSSSVFSEAFLLSFLDEVPPRK